MVIHEVNFIAKHPIFTYCMYLNKILKDMVDVVDFLIVNCFH